MSSMEEYLEREDEERAEWERRKIEEWQWWEWREKRAEEEGWGQTNDDYEDYP